MRRTTSPDSGLLRPGYSTRRVTRRRRRKRSSPSITLARCGGLGALLAGALFATWGYVHGEEDTPWYFDAAANALGFVVPLLFVAGLTGLLVEFEGRRGRLGKVGFVLGFAGAGWGVAHGVVDLEPWYEYFVGRSWLPPLFAGLTLIGVAAIRTKRTRAPRNWGALPLAAGAFGWAYYLTDSGGIFEMRPGHVVFGMLFSLSWMALGGMLWSSDGMARRAMRITGDCTERKNLPPGRCASRSSAATVGRHRENET